MEKTQDSCRVHAHKPETPHEHTTLSWHEEKLMLLEKVCAVALGIFSAFTELSLFAPCFFGGVCLSLYSYKSSTDSSPYKEPVSCCAHSTLEQLTGEKLPALVTLAFLVSEAVCHIDHHPVVFVPIVAIALGNWMGKRGTHWIRSHF